MLLLCRPANEENKVNLKFYKMQLQVALHIFYQRHNPAMMQSASSIAAAHHGKVEELNTKLRKMYGADLNDIAGFTLSGGHRFRIAQNKLH